MEGVTWRIFHYAKEPQEEDDPSEFTESRARAWIISESDDLSERREKCKAIQEWWRKNGPRYHQWWRFWSPWCGGKE
jgi:hypothetical protein